MLLNLMKSKIHKCYVTEANLHYVGSVTIDEDLLDAAGMYENEKVAIVNNNNGSRLETYIIKGPRGSGVICINGAAARLTQPGDEVIIISYTWVEEKDYANHVPKVVFVNKKNQTVEITDVEKHGEIR